MTTSKEYRPKSLILFYVVTYLGLLVTMLIRFFISNIIVQWLNVFFFITAFLVIPVIFGFLLFSNEWQKSNWCASNRHKRFAVLVLFFILLVFAMLSYVSILPVSLFLWLPAIPLCAMIRKSFHPSKMRMILLGFFFVFLTVSPLLVAFSEQQQIVSQAKTLDSIENQASYINSRVEALTTFGPICRANADYWKFLICGSGMCGEMATANINLMNMAGLTAREVTIPGEHAFVEVNVDEEWVIPSGSSMINRTVFANDRLRDPGSLSYVITRTGDSFIELTQYYVCTDLVSIRVTQNYMPVTGVKLSLHRSGVLSATIPDEGLFFYTDVNGTATFHLGKPNFVGQYEKTDLFYKVLVDGKETDYNITSTGTGKSVLLEISL